jgi:hypothetical protein
MTVRGGKERAMPTKQGDVSLLQEPVAQALLQSTIPARLAYVWHDGTPRVIPIWFHWNGKEIVLGSPLTAPKMRVLHNNAQVALTIDSTVWPYKVLLIRGSIQIETVDGVPAEFGACAHRYFGVEQGEAFLEQYSRWFPQSARISIRPEWVGIIDFEDRWTSAIEGAMAQE